MGAQQLEIESIAGDGGGAVYVSDSVSVRTEGGQRVICVRGFVAAHYPTTDRAVEAYEMVKLCASGFANQLQIARAFGYSTRTLRRYQERYESGGIGALHREVGRPSRAYKASRKDRGRDQTILNLKAKGLSNRMIAGRLGVSEKAIRKRLRRLGWQVPEPTNFPLPLPETVEPIEAVVPDPPPQPSSPMPPAPPSLNKERGTTELLPQSWDHDPLDRSMDRTLAAMGMLEDAAPLFAPARDLARAGVLLAVPVLVASGVLSIGRKVYGNIAPAFYGLRTTLVVYILLCLLRIPRAEHLKEHAPVALGRIVGLDRILEVKTLRRKLTVLAARKASQRFARELALRRVKERGEVMGFLYIDGHVRAYHGKHKIAKGYLTRTRLAVPATSDYWVNDQRGDPLFVVTAEANAAMTRMLEPLLKEMRELLGKERRATVVFDRGGWSPQLFVKLLALGFDILTYRKGRTECVSETCFKTHTADLDGRGVQYALFEQPVCFLKGILSLRQITRLSNDHQTHIITSRSDLPAVEVAYRMFERWRQENFFKYLRQEFLIDALIDYELEPDDPLRSVPNPTRQAVDRQLRQARAEIKKLQQAYGAVALGQTQDDPAASSTLKPEQLRIRDQIHKASARVDELRARQKSLAIRVPLQEARPNEDLVKLSTERRQLTNALKLTAYQIESDLVTLLRPHYARAEAEGRTLIQTALQSAATLEPTDTHLRITLAPLSSAHRSKAIAGLCEVLNRSETCFPGTALRMYFAVARPAEIGEKRTN